MMVAPGETGSVGGVKVGEVGVEVVGRALEVAGAG